MDISLDSIQRLIQVHIGNAISISNRAAQEFQQSAYRTGHESPRNLFYSTPEIEEEKEPFPLDLLADDLLDLVFTFLDAKELSSIRHLSKRCDLLASDHSDYGRRQWMDKYTRISSNLNPLAKDALSKPQICYLQQLLDYGEDEVRHWSKCAELVSSLNHFTIEYDSRARTVQEKKIIGLCCNIGKLPTKEISIVVGMKRKYSILSVLVKNLESACEFRRSFHNNHGQASFVPVNTRPSTSLMNELIDGDIFRNLAENIPGFYGRAIDLLSLPQEYEYLRYQVLMPFMYRNITVWQDRKSLGNASLDILAGKIAVPDDFFSNPVFIEDAATFLGGDEETSSCYINFPHLDQTIFARPNDSIIFDPIVHLRKITKHRDDLRSSLAWMIYR